MVQTCADSTAIFHSRQFAVRHINRLIYYPYRVVFRETFARLLGALSYFLPQFTQQHIALILTCLYRAQLKLECAHLVTNASDVFGE